MSEGYHINEGLAGCVSRDSTLQCSTALVKVLQNHWFCYQSPEWLAGVGAVRMWVVLLPCS